MRPIATNYAKSGKRFASAHSRGLRPIPVQQTRQRVSLPQRIRAGCDTFAVATPSCLSSLPQRIRAGCDASDIADYILSELCHSAFARVATALAAGCRLRYVLCHSAFARVATACRGILRCCAWTLPQRIRAGCDSAAVGAALFTSFFATAHSRGLRRCWKPSLTATRFFATAHSRGLRRCWKPSLTATRFFATAHSRGLRRSKTKSSTTLCCFATAHSRGLRPSWRNNPIPSRLLCHSAFARVATVVYCVCCRYCAIFATAHSRGLRLACEYRFVPDLGFATAHSRGLRLSCMPVCKQELPLCHSAFARVATLAQARINNSFFFATAHSRGLRLRKSNAAHCEFAARR